MGQVKDLVHTSLRQLRVWHYREAMRCRALAKAFEVLHHNHIYPKTGEWLERAKAYHTEAVLHDSAVEVLDDVVEGPVDADYIDSKFSP